MPERRIPPILFVVRQVFVMVKSFYINILRSISFFFDDAEKGESDDGAAVILKGKNLHNGILLHECTEM